MFSLAGCDDVAASLPVNCVDWTSWPAEDDGKTFIEEIHGVAKKLDEGPGDGDEAFAETLGVTRVMTVRKRKSRRRQFNKWRSSKPQDKRSV